MAVNNAVGNGQAKAGPAVLGSEERIKELFQRFFRDAVTGVGNLDLDILQEVIDRCLAKNPRDRFQSLLALERKLSAIAGLGEPEPDPRWAASTWIMLIAGLGAFVAIAWILRDQIRQALGF